MIIISTHTPLARRDQTKTADRAVADISTHTPLARRDQAGQRALANEVISTHTPLARRDYSRRQIEMEFFDFYSHASREA